jgi:hypothetical protein
MTPSREDRLASLWRQYWEIQEAFAGSFDDQITSETLKCHVVLLIAKNSQRTHLCVILKARRQE